SARIRSSSPCAPSPHARAWSCGSSEPRSSPLPRAIDRMTCSVERSSIADQPIVVLRDGAGQRVRIACRGAALIGFEVPRHGRSFDIAAGYRDAAEIVARPGSRFGIMAPFAGRIANARYCFEGAEYDLQPGAAPGKRES